MAYKVSGNEIELGLLIKKLDSQLSEILSDLHKTTVKHDETGLHNLTALQRVRTKLISIGTIGKSFRQSSVRYQHLIRG